MNPSTPTEHDLFLWLVETPMTPPLWKDLRRADGGPDVHQELEALLDGFHQTPAEGGSPTPPDTDWKARRAGLRAYLQALDEVVDQMFRDAPEPVSMKTARTFTDRVRFDKFLETGSGLEFLAWYRLRP